MCTSAHIELIANLALQLLRRQVLLAVDGVDDLNLAQINQLLHQLEKQEKDNKDKGTMRNNGGDINMTNNVPTWITKKVRMLIQRK